MFEIAEPEIKEYNYKPNFSPRSHDFEAQRWIVLALADQNGEHLSDDEANRRTKMWLKKFHGQEHILCGEEDRTFEDFADASADPLEILLTREETQEKSKKEQLIRANERALPLLSLLLDTETPFTNMKKFAKTVSRRRIDVELELSRELAQFERAKQGVSIALPQLELF
jgi:hypothetical protein